jgi:tetratricopeptide (TPR) repeat protein
MERIPLERAIRFIKADFDVNQQPCFFFVVGAGISKPPIPLASEIIDLLRKEVNDESIVEPDAKAPLFHRYSWWFRQAFASPDATRPFLERIMLDRPISEASVYLATILTAADKCPARTVLTTNFDDFISRSLSIAGRRYRVIDTPKLLDRYDSRARIPQVVHLHGIASEYDAINLESDIEQRAEETLGFIARLIGDQLLPIVIGYSGWEKDGVVSALRSVLFDAQGRPKPLWHNKHLYWFCYNATDVESVTSLLQDHPSIYCVVPRSALLQPPATAQIRESTVSVLDPSAIEEPTLPAAKVLRRLCRAFGIREPDLFADPIQHFINQIQTLFPSVESKRLTQAHEALSTLLAADLQVFRIEEELASGDLDDAAELFCKLSSSAVGLEPAHNQRIVDGLANAMQSSSLDSKPAVWTKFLELIAACGTLGGAAIKTLRARALTGRGGALCKQKQYSKALVDFGEAVKLSERDDAMAPFEASALVNRGFIQSNIGNHDAGLQDYETVIRRFGGTADPDVQACVVRARVNKAFRLGELGKQDVARTREAITEYDAVARAYSCKPSDTKANIFARTPIGTAVALALNGLSFQNLMLAKHFWAANPNDLEIDAVIARGIEAIQKALERNPDNHMMLGNHSYLEFLRAKRVSASVDEARRILSRAIEIGGEEARGFELADASVNPIPPDAEFIDMIGSIPAVAPGARRTP